jgi:hypothetical protein
MSENWMLSSLRVAEEKAIERSQELHRQADCESRRAKLLENAAIQLENEQVSLQEAIQPFQKTYN